MLYRIIGKDTVTNGALDGIIYEHAPRGRKSFRDCLLQMVIIKFIKFYT